MTIVLGNIIIHIITIKKNFQGLNLHFEIEQKKNLILWQQYLNGAH